MKAFAVGKGFQIPELTDFEGGDFFFDSHEFLLVFPCVDFPRMINHMTHPNMPRPLQQHIPLPLILPALLIHKVPRFPVILPFMLL